MFVLLFGLSFHSLFVGFTLGISDKNYGLLIAILCHQTFEGFALGVRVARVNLKKTIYAYLIDITFALATPVGIILGLIAKIFIENSSLYNISQGVFNCFSAGILIFVGLVHMLVEEVERKEISSSISKFLAIYIGAIIGAVVMSILAIWA
jgi:solute carrier family 39 (zinc transporter), member 1/2/3